MKYRALRTALRFHAEIQVEDGSTDISCDLALLRVLGNKPSLDPFLRKDRLHADGLKVHDVYLEITDGEFIEIRDSVISRFRPMVEMAFDSLEQADTLSQLGKVVEKIWETKDMDSQAPTLQADVIFLG